MNSKKKLISRRLLFLIIISVAALYFLGNYLVNGTIYFNSGGCAKIMIGDTEFRTYFIVGVPIRVVKTDEVTKILQYPIPIATYKDIPKNEIIIRNKVVIDKQCFPR